MKPTCLKNSSLVLAQNSKLYSGKNFAISEKEGLDEMVLAGICSGDIIHALLKWYFVTKIVLTYCEKKNSSD